MSWTDVGSDVFVRENKAHGFGRTNCVAVRVNEGFIVMSPCSNPTPEDFAFLESKGGVFALMEPHAGHTLGLKQWAAKYPSVARFSAPKAIKRLEKVCALKVQPFTEFKTTSTDVRVSEAPGTDASSLMIDVTRAGKQQVSYVDETLIDLNQLPPFPFGLLYWTFGFRTGFRVNKNYLRFYASDRKVLANSILQRLSLKPVLIFAHGPVRASAEDLTIVRALLESI